MQAEVLAQYNDVSTLLGSEIHGILTVEWPILFEQTGTHLLFEASEDTVLYSHNLLTLTIDTTTNSNLRLDFLPVMHYTKCGNSRLKY